jgi:hypothetical protein
MSAVSQDDLLLCAGDVVSLRDLPVSSDAIEADNIVNPASKASDKFSRNHRWLA